MLKIGKKKIKTNIFLAPMSGVTDLAFRMIAREHGAKFAFLEMLDANSIYNSFGPRTHEMMKTIAKDAPLAAQILGGDSRIVVASVEKLLKYITPEFIDINAACPMRKVIKKRAGAYLLKEPDKLFAMIKDLRKSISLPVTVKLRLGYEKNDKADIVDIVKGCEDSGAAAIFIHGRTRGQYYEGEIDYQAIKEVKQAVKIPVIGSGNIFSKELADKMFKDTGCDGILVARGALGNPWIFEELNGIVKTITIEMRIKVLIKHLVYLEKYKDAKITNLVGQMRKVVLWYLRAFPHALSLRKQAVQYKTANELIEFCQSLL